MRVKIELVHFNNVEMNGVKVNIVSQMVQLIINSFEAKPRPQKYMKRKLMLMCYRINDKILPRNDKALLNDIPDVVPNYMKKDKTKPRLH